MRKEIIVWVIGFMVSFIVTYSLVSFFKDDSNGWIGGMEAQGDEEPHGFMRLASWYNDSSGYHLNFSVDGFNNYYKNFTTSKIKDLNQFVGHYVEVGYNSYDDRLNWIHMKD